jgi:hypothetical protein
MLKSDLRPVVEQPKSAQEPEAAKTGYTSPQLFAVATTVELIQGFGGGHFRDMRTGFYYS